MAALCAFQALGLAGTACQPLAPPRDLAVLSGQGTLGGTLTFGDRPGAYGLLATIDEVAKAATVSLIDAATNTTIATTVTTPAGQFALDIKGFTFTTGRVYILEAVKGLNSNKAGADAVRLRTFIKFNGPSTNWTSITGEGVSISPRTTALAIIASHRGLVPANFIGSLATGTFNPAGTGTTQEELDTVEALVRQVLEANLDPLYMITWNGSAFALREATNNEPQPDPEPVKILMVTPDPAATGAQMTIGGVGVGQDGFITQVTLGAIPAQVVGFTATTVTVIVPTGARSGPLTVTNSLGTATTTVTIVPEVLGTIDYSAEPAPEPTPTPEPTVVPNRIDGGIDPDYEFVPEAEKTVKPGAIGGGIDGDTAGATGSVDGGIE